MKPGERYG